MDLYSGMSNDFIRDSQRGTIAGVMADRFFQHYRYRVSDNEVRSWQNSLARMAGVLQLGQFNDQGIIVEYKLPLSSKRLDVMIAGNSIANIPSAVIVELKQWDKVERSEIPECVSTFVGGGIRNVLHPSRQASDYRDYLLDNHTSFSEGKVQLSSCGFLHNLKRADNPILFDASFDSVLATSPSFVLEDTGDAFVEFLSQCIGKGSGREVLREVLTGKERPHKRLLDHAAKTIANEPAFILLDEQRVAFNRVRSLVRTRQGEHSKGIVLVHGGPGTGKSLIALHLLADLAADGYVAVHATGSKAFTETLRKTVGKRAATLMKYFNNFVGANSGDIDVLICDEAHRIRKTSNNQFTKAANRSTVPQIDEIVNASKMSVFLIDDQQVVRPSEVGSSALIKEIAEKNGIPLYEHFLEAQFRCNGSDGYINWVANTLEIERTANILWDVNDAFEMKLVNSPEDLDQMIRAKVDEGNSGRLVAGFCWKWSSPQKDGTLVHDVQIGGWSRPWNAKEGSSTLAVGIPKSNFWASESGGINQVGCVYTAQGFEFDYVGVIWGKDLVYRPGRGWVGQSEFSEDSVVKRGAKSNPEEFLKLVKHTYRVLLTRGLKGCFIYIEDEQTRNFVMSRIENA